MRTLLLWVLSLARERSSRLTRAPDSCARSSMAFTGGSGARSRIACLVIIVGETRPSAAPDPRVELGGSEKDPPTYRRPVRLRADASKSDL
jgi:hypothetical protein